jgi:hypothetical protein
MLVYVLPIVPAALTGAVKYGNRNTKITTANLFM